MEGDLWCIVEAVEAVIIDQRLRADAQAGPRARPRGFTRHKDWPPKGLIGLIPFRGTRMDGADGE